MEYRDIIDKILDGTMSRQDACDALTEIAIKYSFVSSVLVAKPEGGRFLRAIVLSDPHAPPKLLVEVIGYGDSLMPYCVEKMVEVSTNANDTIKLLRFENGRLYFLTDNDCSWWVNATLDFIDKKAQ